MYAINKANARTRNTKPTKTDQSQARDTDLNVIVGRYLTGVPINGNAAEPMYGDFTRLPKDYRQMIELARSIEARRKELPKELATLTVEDLVTLDNEALVKYLTPVDKPTDDKKDEQK